jgi:hypothetical protein
LRRRSIETGITTLEADDKQPIVAEWKTFQERARKAMEAHFQVVLDERSPKGFPKKFDLVSPTDDIVGDANIWRS